jgi:penicillin-binding protein 2
LKYKDDELKENLRRRLAIFSSITLALFTLLFFRLWFLQVMAVEKYEKLAEENRVREVSIDALRGQILDRQGTVLADNHPSLTLAVLPGIEKRPDVIKRIAKVFSVDESELKKKVLRAKEGPYKPRVVLTDISMEKAAYVKEHAEDFPYVGVEFLPVRYYPLAECGAHLIGYVGEISEEEAAQEEFAQCELGDVIGKTGVEREFDQLLRGGKGRREIEVDAMGRVTRTLEVNSPVPGHHVKLTVDIKLQKVVEDTLKDAISLARRKGARSASAGAALVLDPRSGEILAMASYPTYDPNAFAQGISEADWKYLTSKKSNFPLLNRVLMAAYPPGSTFKPFTMIAGLQGGVINFSSTFKCEGRWEGMGESWPKYCWKRSGHGLIDLRRGMAESCDIVFYEIGYKLYKQGQDVLQEWSRKFGFGKKTEISFPSESPGRVPDRQWKKEHYSDPQMKVWLPGDDVNLAIGQGDLLVTPLQLGRAFAALINGGKVYRPHLVKEIRRYDGSLARRIEPELQWRVPIAASRLSMVKSYLGSVVEEGTAKKAFDGFQVKVGGKTGTAEVQGKEDFAWFVGFAPLDNPRYVVVVLIEEGGHGGEIAAPAVRRILAYLFKQPMVMPNIVERSR